MKISGHYIKIKGIKTYYETNNVSDEKPAILCIHTAGRECRQYHGIMELFKDKYQVIAPDMPAHGKSWPLPHNKAITDKDKYAEFIWEFAKLLKLEHAIIMGCSLGGNIVYKLAQQYPVKAIISLQGADYTPSISEVARELMDHPHVSLQHSHIDFSDSLVGKYTGPAEREFIIWGVKQEISVTKKADLNMYNGFDVRENMDKITCPVLVVRGQDDWIVDAQAVEDTIKRLTKAKKVVFEQLPGIGHFPAVESPDTIARIVDDFIQSL